MDLLKEFMNRNVVVLFLALFFIPSMLAFNFLTRYLPRYEERWSWHELGTVSLKFPGNFFLEPLIRRSKLKGLSVLTVKLPKIVGCVGKKKEIFLLKKEPGMLVSGEHVYT